MAISRIADFYTEGRLFPLPVGLVLCHRDKHSAIAIRVSVKTDLFSRIESQWDRRKCSGYRSEWPKYELFCVKVESVLSYDIIGGHPCSYNL